MQYQVQYADFEDKNDTIFKTQNIDTRFIGSGVDPGINEVKRRTAEPGYNSGTIDIFFLK